MNKDLIEQTIIENLRAQDSNAQVKIFQSSLGWINLRIASQIFEGLDEEERAEKINQGLRSIDMHLGMYPFLNYMLLTPEESAEQPMPLPIQLPLWSEILLAPSPDIPKEMVEDNIPLVVTFYSFKGGVGRTTAMVITADLLVKAGRRVVMIDFDLEAPGLTVMLPSVENEDAKYGVLDYIYQRWLTPEENIPPIAECVRRVGRGSDLFLIPAGKYDENYIHRLADFEVEKFYRRAPNPIHQLIEDITKHLNPDVILIDARTGFDEVGAVALFDLAHLAMICFTPSEQSYHGLEWVIKAARKQKEIQGRPELRFILTPMPPVDAKKKAEWLTTASDYITELWGNENLVAEELRAVIDYQPAITVVDDILQDIPASIRINYQPIVDFINAALPTLNPSDSVANQDLDKILKELKFKPITADQLELKDIPTIFQRTNDFPKFLQPRTNLIRGAKGTGKSILFRLFVQQPKQAKELAKPYTDLENVLFIGGHGRTELDKFILTSDDFASFESQVGEQRWENLWATYLLLRLVYYIPDVLIADENLKNELSRLIDHPSHEKFVNWLVDIAQKPARIPLINDTLRNIDTWLEQQKQRVWLLYDELDAGFGSGQKNYARRTRALESLFSWWLESSGTFPNIVMKCFIREDIWQELTFSNKSHYTGRDMSLRWQEEDLWRLILRQIISSSPTYAQDISLKLGQANSKQEQLLDQFEKMNVEQLRQMLYLLWGKRMGQGVFYFTHRWILKRIADGQKNSFPRSLVLLLSESVVEEKKSATRSEVVLSRRSLQKTIEYVSKKRVEEVREEYPEFKVALDKLNGQSSPLNQDTLIDLWQGIDPSDLIRRMLKSGILVNRPPSKNEDTPRYTVAELYLSGLGMRRKGQK